jgi:hypothetical protein
MKKQIAVVGTPSTYICNVTVRHEGDRYRKGEEIELLPSEAAELLAADSIEPKFVLAGSAPIPASPAPVTRLSPSTLGKMNVGELINYAASIDVKLDPAFTKDQIIEAISAVQEVKEVSE